MLLALDIGNTNIKTGLFRDGQLQHSWRLTVDKRRTADEYGVQMEDFFRHLHLPVTIVDGIIFSSVVPSINYTIEHMFSIYFPNVPVMQVKSDLQTGIELRYDHNATLGSDRICNAVAARKLYGETCITVDFGTATTFGVIRENVFLGGVICPGFKVSTDALLDKAAMLPKVEYTKPKHVIGSNTEHCLQSGIVYGYVGQVEYLVKKIKKELGVPGVKVIATGGMGEIIASETDCIDIHNPTLTLEGLCMIYDMNRIDGQL